MQKTNNRPHISFGFVATALMLLLVFFATIFIAPVRGAPALQTTNTSATKSGTVIPAHLNVRDGAGTTFKVIGQLGKGTQVQILRSQGGWLQIVFPGGQAGAGWVLASWVAQGGASTSSAGSSTAGSVAAPTAVAFKDPLFTWKWTGATAVGAVDWYFDVQMFRGRSAAPYQVFVAEPNKATLKDGVYTYNSHPNLECDTTWVVQIATRTNGKFSGWISAPSNRLSLGAACNNASNSAAPNATPEPNATEQPTEEPQPTEAPTETAP